MSSPLKRKIVKQPSKIKTLRHSRTSHLGLLNSVGAYGSGLTCETLLNEKLADYCWLANAKSWPNYNKVLKSNIWSLVQGLPREFKGLEVDMNEINPNDWYFGQFGLPEDPCLQSQFK